MDGLTQKLARFAVEFPPEALPPEILMAAKIRLVDTLGCATGGYASEAARIGLTLGLGAIPRKWPGRILGRRERTTAETATFVNSAMARFLDFNDTGPGSHPSDCIGALLSIAEAAGATGPRLLSSIVVAYEVLVRMAFGTKFRQRGYDQGFVSAVGTAAGVAHLLGLPLDKAAHGISIAAAANVPLRVSRAGELSYWKSAATPFHVKNGLAAALLAAEGMTGPDQPFEGRFGLWEQITGPFEIEKFPTEGGPYMLPQWSRLKYWPVEYNAQISVWAALALREKLDVEAVERIEISTYHQAWHEIGSEAAKWDPRTRETADHSLPYIFAKALTDGEITVASFDEAAFMAPEIRPLMQRISVRADEKFTEQFPAAIPVRVEAVTKGGESHMVELSNPLGHNKNPMSDTQVTEKFMRLAVPVLGEDTARRAAEHWRAIETRSSLTEALDLFIPA